MKKILSKILGPMAGKIKYQGLFEHLHQLSLNGMNIGGGGSTDTSGERFAMEYIHHKLSKNDDLTIFDVGANVGDYSILLKEVFKEKAHIFSFEPSKKTYNKFLIKTKDVKHLNSYNFGFGDENTRITLFSDADESGLASLYQRRLDHFNLHMNKTEEIEILTIDGFCAQHEIKHIHFLKIDVEGHETKVLEGAKNMVNNQGIDYIQFEFGGCNIDSRTFFQDFYYLLKDNYHIYRIVRDGLFKIENYKEMYEAFITTNYIAERKNLIP